VLKVSQTTLLIGGIAIPHFSAKNYLSKSVALLGEKFHRAIFMDYSTAFLALSSRNCFFAFLLKIAKHKQKQFSVKTSQLHLF
jgi:hypothetical protein